MQSIFYIVWITGFPSLPIAKFNSTVPGTLDIESDDKTSVVFSSIPWTTPPTTLTANPTSSENDSRTLITITSTIAIGSNIVEVGSTLFYILIGAGSGISILLFIILIMFLSVFAIACFQNRQKRKLSSRVIAIAQQQNQGTTSPYR